MTPVRDAEQPRMQTSIGYSTSDEIWVQGYQLADELMGNVDLGGMFFLLISGRLPNQSESCLFNAILVALADHGLTPTALAARLTYTGAPEALQGAVAAGILGAGSVFLGVLEDVGRMLSAAGPDDTSNGAELDRLAAEVIAEQRARSGRIPGLGHPVHKAGDPRTARLLELAREHNLLGPHTRLMLRVQEQAARSNQALPLNAAGASGALLCDLRIDPRVVRGVAVVARAAGVVGHLAEEVRAPMGGRLWRMAERDTDYVSPRVVTEPS
ncbi:citryl-CoA lyase [Mycolicibacterium neoaurum]|uniref:citryl-CoA lyase n=1 Tax=Mycolicibacterium neoaurum TaxID=1795 RepID=UPI001F4CFAAA|nr:citryl-CoA lyase [Mycolicibacterium neoaurum]